MYKNYFTLISFIFFSAGFISVNAQTKPLNIVTTAVPFLRIPSDARAGGMGDVGIATSPDANASLLNNAKTPFATNRGAIGFTYTPWLRGLGLQDVYLANVAGYYKLDETQAITASLKYFSLGNIQFTDESGNDLNSTKPNEYSFDAGYSRKLSDKLALGIALRYIHSKLASGSYNGQSYKGASAVAGDISLFHDGTSGMSTSGLNWGVTISNLGSKISYTNDANRKDYLPANLGVGLTYTQVFSEDAKITFAADVNKLLVPTPPQLSGSNTSGDSTAIANYRSKGVLNSVFNSFNDGPGQYAGGVEFMYQNQFALRGGYFRESESKGGRKFFTLGVGLYLDIFGVNFSYLIPTGNYAVHSPLDNTFHTTMTINFNKN